MTAIDLQKFDTEEAIRIENLILSAKLINHEISGLTEETPTEGILEKIKNHTFLIESLLSIAYDKNAILHESFEMIWDLSDKLKLQQS